MGGTDKRRGKGTRGMKGRRGKERRGEGGTTSWRSTLDFLPPPLVLHDSSLALAPFWGDGQICL